jgi:hypothetical protein
LRIHRGKSSSQQQASPRSLDQFSPDTEFQNAKATYKFRSKFRYRHQNEIKISISCPSSEQLTRSPCHSATSSIHIGISSPPSKEEIQHLRNLSTNTNRSIGKRHIKNQVKRFRVETKAAKTLALIVGGFIFCWLPFFTIYLIQAFCEQCITELVFSVLFWLGYCNSAVNPMIYALFSRDFRFAFKKVLYKCFCPSKYVNPTPFSVIHGLMKAPAAVVSAKSPCLEYGSSVPS